MARADFHPLTVSRVRPLTDDAVALSFTVPDNLAADFEFIPGQYLTLRADIDGEDTRRSYSICSKPGDPLEVGIKHLPGGRFSSYAQTLTVGAVVDVMTPQGNFTATPGGRHEYLLIAAGSGITPCLSIAKTVLAQEPQSRIALIYGNRNTASIMFRQDIGHLKDLYTQRLMVVNVLSREKQEAEWLNGRVSAEKLSYLSAKRLIDLTACDGVYICGPAAMVEDVRTALGDTDPVHTELFTTAGMELKEVITPTAADDSESIDVSITIDGAEHTIAVNAGNETVLAAANRSGLDLPFSCAGGMCCTCRCKVVSGKTAMDMNFSLAEWEVEAGFTLACQTRPLDSDVVLDFDEF